MEFLLQWLDELEDTLAAVLFAWHRFGRVWLLVAGSAAGLLHVDRIGSILPALLLMQLSVISVLIWGVGGLVASLFERRIRAAT